MAFLSRHVMGRVVIAGTFVLVAVVACGGSTATGLDGPASSSGTSGTSGTSGASGTSGTSGGSCNNVACPEIGCGPGTVSRVHEGQCCPTCDPIPNQCDGKPDSCTNKKGCGADYERFEYAPGCCDCRLAKCKGVTCPPFQSCGLGEHADLSGCCGVCVKDADVCKNGATPCSTYQCPVGYKPNSLGTSDGPGCCSSCEVDENYCATERAANATYISTRLTDPAALKCQTKDDCIVANLTNACAGDCGHAVAKAEASKITNDITTYGLQHCSQCPPQPIGCPAVVLVARCGNNQKCTLAPE